MSRFTGFHPGGKDHLAQAYPDRISLGSIRRNDGREGGVSCYRNFRGILHFTVYKAYATLWPEMSSLPGHFRNPSSHPRLGGLRRRCTRVTRTSIGAWSRDRRRLVVAGTLRNDTETANCGLLEQDMWRRDGAIDVCQRDLRIRTDLQHNGCRWQTRRCR